MIDFNEREILTWWSLLILYLTFISISIFSLLFSTQFLLNNKFNDPLYKENIMALRWERQQRKTEKKVSVLEVH